MVNQLILHAISKSFSVMNKQHAGLIIPRKKDVNPFLCGIKGVVDHFVSNIQETSNMLKPKPLINPLRMQLSGCAMIPSVKMALNMQLDVEDGSSFSLK